MTHRSRASLDSPSTNSDSSTTQGGYLAYESPHHGVMNGLMLETPEDYRARRRTQNHVMARAAREGLVFCKEPDNEHRYRHDGDVSNEWELVTRAAAPPRGH